MAYTTQLGRAIIDEAQRWLGMECVEKPFKSNKVYCAKHLDPNEMMMWGTKGGAMAWCGSFCYAVVNAACANIGRASESRITMKTGNWRSAKLWRDTKDPHIKVDNKPAPGCVFFRPSSHVGIVVQVFDDGGIAIIHGNTDDDDGNDINLDVKSKAEIRKYKFVHVENMLPDLATVEAPALLRARSEVYKNENEQSDADTEPYYTVLRRREAWN